MKEFETIFEKHVEMMKEVVNADQIIDTDDSESYLSLLTSPYKVLLNIQQTSLRLCEKKI